MHCGTTHLLCLCIGGRKSILTLNTFLYSSSDGCIIGQSTIAAGAVLQLDSADNTSTVTKLGLLNGTFASTLPILSANETSADDANQTASLQPFFNSSVSSTNATGFSLKSSARSQQFSVTLDLSVGHLLAYSAPLFAGSVSRVSNTSNAPQGASLLLPDNSFAVLNFDSSNKNSDRVVLFDSVADTAQWSLTVDDTGTFEVVSLQSSSCSQPCSSHGTCLSDGTCACQAGFTGDTCGQSTLLVDGSRMPRTVVSHPFTLQTLAIRDILARVARNVIVQAAKPAVRGSPAQVFALHPRTQQARKVGRNRFLQLT